MRAAETHRSTILRKYLELNRADPRPGHLTVMTLGMDSENIRFAAAFETTLRYGDGGLGTRQVDAWPLPSKEQEDRLEKAFEICKQKNSSILLALVRPEFGQHGITHPLWDAILREKRLRRIGFATFDADRNPVLVS